MATYRELSLGLPKQCESLRDEVHHFALEVMRPAAMAIDRGAQAHPFSVAEPRLVQVLKAAYGLGYHPSFPSATADSDCRPLAFIFCSRSRAGEVLVSGSV